jgi:hypothetical protein
MEDRRYKCLVILISFMWWMKTNKPEKYTLIENKIKNLRIPLNVVLDMIDSLLYYKSEVRALAVFLKYIQNMDEISLFQRAGDLAQWSRTWRAN